MDKKVEKAVAKLDLLVEEAFGVLESLEDKEDVDPDRLTDVREALQVLDEFVASFNLGVDAEDAEEEEATLDIDDGNDDMAR